MLVEAWKNRTPVASLRVDPDGLIRQHEAGFVADDDAEALTRGVMALLEDDDALPAYGRQWLRGRPSAARHREDHRGVQDDLDRKRRSLACLSSRGRSVCSA